MPRKPKDPEKPGEFAPALAVIEGGVTLNDPVPLKRKAGRPTLYSQEAEDRILDGMYEGLDFMQAIKKAGFKVRTVYEWMDAHPDFRSRCARAREALTEIRLQRMRDRIALADARQEDAGLLRVMLQHEQWAAERISPRLYGNRSTTEVTNVNITEQNVTVRFEGRFRDLGDEEIETIYEVLADATDED
jgi:hypothetical protein